MRHREDGGSDLLMLKRIYSIGELAREAGVSRHFMLRLLRANKIAFLQVGRSLSVPLSEIQEKIPPLWKTLQMRPCASCASRSRTLQG
jgi:excisionase family DNA binding protein